MFFFGKLVAGFLGLLIAGIPGVIVGLILGHLFDRGIASAMGLGGDPQATREAFFRTTFALMGYMAKADGRVSEEEVAHSESLFAQLGLSVEQRVEAIGLFKAGTEAGFSPEATIDTFMQQGGGHPILKRTLLMFLVTLAAADGEMHVAEREALRRIGALLGYDSGSVDDAAWSRR